MILLRKIYGILSKLFNYKINYSYKKKWHIIEILIKFIYCYKKQCSIDGQGSGVIGVIFWGLSAKSLFNPY